MMKLKRVSDFSYRYIYDRVFSSKSQKKKEDTIAIVQCFELIACRSSTIIFPSNTKC